MEVCVNVDGFYNVGITSRSKVIAKTEITTVAARVVADSVETHPTLLYSIISLLAIRSD